MEKKSKAELTREKILTTSEKLFIEKGFEKTTTQEIVNETGLSKGSVFHHFKSKEEILAGVLEAHVETMIQDINQWLKERQTWTAQEKLRGFFDEPDSTPEDERNSHLFKIAILTGSPHIIVTGLKMWTAKMSPIVSGLMKEGIQDGSIQTDYPDECAQLLILLYSIWTDHLTLACSLEELEKRLRFIQHTMKVLGADVLSDTFIEIMMDFAKGL